MGEGLLQAEEDAQAALSKSKCKSLKKRPPRRRAEFLKKKILAHEGEQSTRKGAFHD